MTFQYPGAEAPALRGLNLDVPAGALVAVTGPVGSGKSALARAILGVYPVTSGSVLIDGKPLADLPASERRGLVGYLPQDASLFSGSLRQNIAFDPAGRGADDGVHRRAMRLAALEDDVAAFPHGLDTQIGDAGIRLSGGQRQRVGLARALAAAASCSRAARSRRSLLRCRRRDRSGHRRLAPARVRVRGAAGAAGHHRAVLPPPGGLPVRRHGARPRAGCRGGNGHARETPRGRRSLRADLPGAARRRIAARWCRHYDDRPRGSASGKPPCPRVGVPSSDESAGPAAGLGGAGGVPGAGCRRRRARSRRSSFATSSIAISPSAAEGLLALALLYLLAVRGDAGGDLSVRVSRGHRRKRMLSDLRTRLFAHLQRLPTSYFDRMPLGDVISRCTADVDTLDTVFTSGVAVAPGQSGTTGDHRGRHGRAQSEAEPRGGPDRRPAGARTCSCSAGCGRRNVTTARRSG